VVTITYRNSDVNGTYDAIAFKGFGLAPRTLQVRYNHLGGTFPGGTTTVLRPGESLQTAFQLFPLAFSSSNSTLINPNVATGVVLPDGRQYRLRYNNYAELWRVELPTGGAFEYDHLGGGSDMHGVVGSGDPNSGGEMGIYRRVTVRRVYPDGATCEGKMVYSATTTTTGTPPTSTTSVIVDHQDASGTVSLAKQEHLFYGDPGPSLYPTVLPPTAYNPWNDAKEFATKQYDRLNGALLQRVDNSWFQTSIS
jgi:YD repeat-containing protein